jgi:hypothetical protein
VVEPAAGVAEAGVAEAAVVEAGAVVELVVSPLVR